ncbi:sugar ABC transporter substrate-binding protein [Gandjariella thermophila]|uniref:Sugar ABC transporter substrate-binding protein n=1 Tax=Gandjariella thermophila TaxID=1931992 RepID=A0A4D4J6V1_9PSEU|nr:sugar ABC transporter substrate-binding protein [Gandjariella thermophila]GDY30269.1 sugar ABC transporter substrate-binding protein [Gandjariella thermophila]
MTRPLLAVAWSIALVAGAGLTGCSGPATPAARPTIGLVVQNTEVGFAKQWSAGFRAGAQLAGGVDATVTGPPTDDGAMEVDLFRRLTGTAKAGVAVAPLTPELLAGSEADAVDSGIPVVAVSTPPAPGSGVKLLIGNDSYALGEQLADELIRRLPPNATGKVILGNVAPGLAGQDARARGMRDRLTQRMPNLRVMGPFDTQKARAANLSAWQLLVTANPDAVAFLGTGDLDAVNLASIRASTGGTWLAAGYSVDPEALRAVKDGRLFAVVSPDHFLTAAIAGWLLAEHARTGRPLPEGWYAQPGLVVTSANVDEISWRESSDANRLAWFRPQLDRATAGLAAFLRPLDQVR